MKRALAVVILTIVGGVTPAMAQTASPCGPRSSFGRPFADTLGNLERLPSRENAGWLSAGAAAAIATHQADAGVTHSLSRSESLHQAFGGGAIIGGTPFQLGAAMATLAIGGATNHPCVARLGADLIGAQLLAQTLTIGMKQSFRRARPEGLGFSFPSGHTTVSFATATVLQQHFGWKVGAPAYAVASYVAASRVQTKKHYLSDVAFGAALGIVAGRTVSIGSRHRLLLAPMATPGGGGARVTWLPAGGR